MAAGGVSGDDAAAAVCDQRHRRATGSLALHMDTAAGG